MIQTGSIGRDGKMVTEKRCTGGQSRKTTVYWSEAAAVNLQLRLLLQKKDQQQPKIAKISGKSRDISYVKPYLVLSKLKLSSIFWLDVCSLSPFTPHALLPPQPLLLLCYTRLDKSYSCPFHTWKHMLQLHSLLRLKVSCVNWLLLYELLHTG